MKTPSPSYPLRMAHHQENGADGLGADSSEMDHTVKEEWGRRVGEKRLDSLASSPHRQSTLLANKHDVKGNNENGDDGSELVMRRRGQDGRRKRRNAGTQGRRSHCLLVTNIHTSTLLRSLAKATRTQSRFPSSLPTFTPSVRVVSAYAYRLFHHAPLLRLEATSTSLSPLTLETNGCTAIVATADVSVSIGREEGK